MTELISFAVGLIMPAIIEFVNKKVGAGKDWIKWIIAFVSCLIVGILTTIFVEQVDITNWSDLFTNVSAVFIASQAVYNLYWRDSLLQKRISG